MTDGYVKALFYAFGRVDAEFDAVRPGDSTDFANYYMSLLTTCPNATVQSAYALWLKGVE